MHCRGNAGAEIAQRHGAQAQRECDGCEGPAGRTPSAGRGIRIRIVEQAELLVLPVEFPGVRDDSADAGSMPAHPLGQRVHDDVGAVLDGLQKYGVVKVASTIKGKTVGVGDLRDLRNVREVEHGVPMVSTKIARVLGVMAFSYPFRSLCFTNFV